ncbi:MAG: Crp/Fnr family transcriptional regulator [Gammaproteobacteria bacterium]|nr:Crp/Fnr family transcriptional regulator [Gammaproteobacteria bacterium]
MASEQKLTCIGCPVRPLSLFADVPDSNLKEVGFQPAIQTYRSGDTIIHADSDDDALYTIRSGMVKLEGAVSNTHSRIVRLLKTGDTLGLHALHQAKHPHTARALGTVELCRIPHHVIHHVGQEVCELKTAISQRIAEDVAMADMWITDFSSGAVPRRLAKFLLYLSKLQTGSSENEVTLLSRDDMAATLGVRQESISRTLTQFKSEGLLDARSRNTFIMDKQGLVRLAE